MDPKASGQTFLPAACFAVQGVLCPANRCFCQHLRSFILTSFFDRPLSAAFLPLPAARAGLFAESVQDLAQSGGSFDRSLVAPAVFRTPGAHEIARISFPSFSNTGAVPMAAGNEGAALLDIGVQDLSLPPACKPNKKTPRPPFWRGRAFFTVIQ